MVGGRDISIVICGRKGSLGDGDNEDKRTWRKYGFCLTGQRGQFELMMMIRHVGDVK